MDDKNNGGHRRAPPTTSHCLLAAFKFLAVLLYMAPFTQVGITFGEENPYVPAVPLHLLFLFLP